MKKILSLIILLMVLFSASTLVSTTVASADENPTTHQVLFKIDGETVKEETVKHNGYVQTPETPSVEDKIFLYWYLEGGDVNNRFSFKTRITEDITLCAFFENTEKYYTVTFRVDGEDISVQRVKEGESAIAPNNLKVPEGKTFSRWNENFLAVRSDLVVEAVLDDVFYKVNVYAENEQLDIFYVKYGESLDLSGIVAPEKPNYVMDGFIGETDYITSNGDVYVNYVPKPISLTFYNDGLEYESLTTRYGETAKMPQQAPEAEEDYYFAGWALGSNDGELFDFSTLVYEDTEFHAVFKPVEKPKYEVKFYDHNGVQYGVTQIISEGGSAIVPGYPVREGYTPVRWDVSVENVASNLDVYPIYKLTSYKVTFVDYLGEIAVEYVLHGQSVAIDQDLVRTQEGYEFIRFDRSLKNITSETTINAVYRVKTYEVRFYSSNYTSLGGLQQIKHGQDAKVPNPEKEGYTFLGWKNMYTDQIEETTNITKNCSFIATYSRNVYTVTFMEGETELHSTEIEYGRSFSLYSYEKEGYLFDGWYYDKELNNKCYSTSVIADTVFYAKWIKKVEEIRLYTVSFIVDGVIYNQQVIEHGGSIVMPAVPSKEGYVFEVWETDYGNYGAGTPIANKVYADWVINAKFREATYTVTFKYGNSQYTGCSVQVNYGEPAVLPEGTNTDKTGHIFKGWDKDISCITSNMTVNAVYEPFKYTVTFVDSDNNVLFTQTVKHGEYVNWVDNPVKEGYTFAGWSPSLNYNTAVTEDGKIYKALFNVNMYKIYYYVDGVLWNNYTTDVAYGNYINLRGEPSINKEQKKFLGWSEIPEKMPAHDVEVYGTTYTYQYFNVYYLIDGEVWKIKNIREGKEIGTMTVNDVPNKEWKDAHENITFKHWGDQPYYMPAEDVYVHAVIEKYEYYKVYFYIDGEIYKVVTCLEGKAIPRPNANDIQAMFPETKVFDGWGDLEWYMPSHDVEAHAEFIYKNYYNLNYYIEDKLFKSFTLLEGTTIEGTEYQLTHADVPKDYLPEHKEFRGWSRIPQWMPQEDVVVNAYVHEYKLYKVTYKDGFDTVKELEVYEGQPIPIIDAPESDGTRWFTGWNSSYETMPGYNIQVSAQWLYLNDISYKTEQIDETAYYLHLDIGGKVNFIGIKLCIEVNTAQEAIVDDNYASYNFENNTLVYVSGEVITEKTTLVSFYCHSRPDRISFSSFEIYTLDEQGNIVTTVYYMNGTKH